MLKLFLAAYQAVIVIISALFILYIFRALFDTSPCTVYHWDYIIKVSFIVVPSFVFCLCNVLRLSLPKWSLFESWKSLGSISIVFAVLWTCLFGYIRILQAGYVSGGASLANIVAPEARKAAPDLTLNDQLGGTISVIYPRAEPVALKIIQAALDLNPGDPATPHTPKSSPHQYPLWIQNNQETTLPVLSSIPFLTMQTFPLTCLT